MALPEVNQPNTKNNALRATKARPPRPIVPEAETCFRTPSTKENFEGQPNRTVAENTVLRTVTQAGRKIRWRWEMTTDSVASEDVAGKQCRQRGTSLFVYLSSYMFWPKLGHLQFLKKHTDWDYLTTRLTVGLSRHFKKSRMKCKNIK
jgi:hypothetical protein